MSQKIEIVKCTSDVIQITLTDHDGNLRALSSGEKIIFGLKRKCTDTDLLFVKAALPVDLGLYNVELCPEDTDLEPGKYFYDVGLQSGGDYFNIVEPSPFVVQANVTKWGCNE